MEMQKKLADDITKARKVYKQRHQFSKEKNVNGSISSDSDSQSNDEYEMTDKRYKSPEGISSFIIKDKMNDEEEKEVRINDKEITSKKKVDMNKLNSEKKFNKQEMKLVKSKLKNKGNY